MTENNFLGRIQRYREITETYQQQIIDAELYINDDLYSEADIDDTPYYRDATENEDGIFILTGLNKDQFDEIYISTENSFNLSRGRRGRKPKLAHKDRLLLTLTWFRHNENFSKLAMQYRQSQSCIHLTIMKTIDIILPVLTEKYIIPLKKGKQLEYGINIPAYPSVALILDCTIFNINRPCGSFDESRLFYSNKHGRYCTKMEIGVLPNGSAAFYSQLYPGSKHDYSIFSMNLQKYKRFILKETSEMSIDDEDGNSEWSIMADKGYIGMQSHCRSIIPTRLSGRVNINPDNQEIARERIICENFFGRVKMSFKICRDRFRGDFELLNKVVPICLALTNLLIRDNPLRIQDSSYNAIIRESMYNSRRNEIQVTDNISSSIPSNLYEN